LSENHPIVKTTLTGLRWSTVNQLSSQGLTFIIAIVMARLLSPNEFGLIAMISVVIGYGKVLSDFGISSAVIQNNKASSSYINTAFVLNLILGWSVAFTILILAKPISLIYQIDILYDITLWLSLSYFISPLGTISSALLSKKLDFKLLFFASFFSALLSGILGIYAAYGGQGVWSLVIKSISNTSLSVLFYFIFAKWLPNFSIKRNHIRSIIDFSLPLLGSRTLFYITNNVDSFLIGKYLGQTSLGVYNRAYSLMNVPTNIVTKIVSSVLFPSLSLIQKDIQKVREVYLDAIKMIATITFPLATIGFILSEEIIMILIGSQWIDVIPLFQILIFLGAIRSISSLNGVIYTSQAKNKLQLNVNIVTRTLFILLLFVGVKYGLKGIALAYASGGITIAVINIFFMGTVIKLSMLKIIENLRRIIFVNVMVFLIAYSFYSYISLHANIYLTSIILIITILVVYLFLLIKIEREFVNHFFKIIIDSFTRT